MRKGSAENVNALKTAFKLVIGDVGGLEAAASCSRVGVSQLSDYGNIGSEKMAPVDVVLDLERVSGRAHVTAAMALQLGYELAPVGVRPHHELVWCLQRIATDNGKLFAQAVHVLGGGGGPAERRKMRAELADVICAAREALAAIPEDSCP